jgi:hypothetical protein
VILLRIETAIITFADRAALFNDGLNGYYFDSSFDESFDDPRKFCAIWQRDVASIRGQRGLGDPTQQAAK